MKYILLSCVIFLSACSTLQSVQDGFRPDPPVTDDVKDSETGMRPTARPSNLATVQDIMVKDENVELLAAKTNALGTTVASLGNPAQGGLWLKTPLVTSRQKGSVTSGDGVTVTLDLIPLAGANTAGSRLSLAAFQVLGIPLTDLPKLVVTSR